MPSSLSPDIEAQAISLIRGFAMDAPLQRQERPPGHGDGARPARPRALQPGAQARPGRSRRGPTATASCCPTATPRSSSTRCCTCRGYGLELDDIKAFRQFESRTPGHPEAGHTAGHRGHHRAARPGLRRRRRHGDRRARAARPLRRRPRRPPHVRHRRRRLLHGGRQPRGRVARRAPRPRPPDLRVRRQPRHDRRPDRRSPTPTTSASASPPTAGTSSTSARSPTTATPSRPRCSPPGPTTTARRLLVLRSHIGHPSPDHTDDHDGPRQPVHAPRTSPRTKAVMGIPDEPFWAPARPSSRRTAPPPPSACREDRGRVGRVARRARRRRAGGVGRGVERHRHQGLGGRPPDVRAGREDRHPPGDRQGPRARASPTSPGCRRAPPTSPATPAPSCPTTPASRRADDTRAGARSTTASASTPWARRSVGMAHARRASLPVGGTFFVFLDYMRPPVRLASLSRAKAVFVFSHDSVGVGEDGPTHQPVEHLATLRAIPGLQVIRPADANETVGRVAGRGRPRRADGDRAHPPGRDGVHRRLGRRAGRRHRPRQRPAPGARDRRHRQRGRRWPSTPPSGSTADGIADAGRQPAELGPLRRARTPSTATRCCPPGVPVLSVEAGTTFGWERFADDSIGIDRFGASAPGDVVLDRLGINVDHVVRARPGRSSARSLGRRKELHDGTTDPPVRGVRPEPVARQPQARLPDLGPARRAARRRHPRPDVEPDDLPEGDLRLGRLRRAVPQHRRRRRAGRRRLLDARARRHRRRLRRVRPGLRRQRRRRRLRQRRGRSRPGPRLGPAPRRPPASCTSASPAAT